MDEFFNWVASIFGTPADHYDPIMAISAYLPVTGMDVSSFSNILETKVGQMLGDDFPNYGILPIDIQVVTVWNAFSDFVSPIMDAIFGTLEDLNIPIGNLFDLLGLDAIIDALYKPYSMKRPDLGDQYLF